MLSGVNEVACLDLEDLIFHSRVLAIHLNVRQVCACSVSLMCGANYFYPPGLVNDSLHSVLPP